MDKVRLLYIGDYSNTGFGTVAKGLLRPLSNLDKYNILQMGINFYHIDKDPQEKWDIVPAGDSKLKGNVLYSPDPYGFKRVKKVLKEFDPDIVFINNDYTIAKAYMEDAKGKPTALAKHRSLKVLYAPVDAEPVPSWFVDQAKRFDLNIAYTDWQRQMLAEHDPMFHFMPVLYHGFDPDIYFPMDKDVAKSRLIEILLEKNEGAEREMFEERILGSFLVYFVGTNQWRKDLPCLFRAFAKLRDVVPNATLIPHTNALPSGNNGWNLANLQSLTQVESAIIMRRANLYTEQEMNVFYNAADMLAYPTRGEGFGLPSLESMAVKTPVAATAFGPQLELHRNDRGYLVDILDVVPGDIRAWQYYALPDHRSLFAQMRKIHDDPERAKVVANNAYDFAKDLTWKTQASKLDDILTKLLRAAHDANYIQK